MLKEYFDSHEHKDQPPRQLRLTAEAGAKESAYLDPRSGQKKGGQTDEGDGGQDIHLKKAKVTPTASASMLVASARGSMERKEKEQSTSSLSSRDSRTMLIPMMDKRRKAIQWSTAEMKAWNWMPSSQPSSGIMA